ncbi:MAG: hypothetical protein ABI867_04975 [Kofleriaceae bacterium]
MKVSPRRWLGLLLVFCTRIALADPSDSDERYVRVDTSRGPVHIWQPAGYDHETAATVVYVHGFRTTADEAWRTHRLRDQFHESGINALFVVCEAPTSEEADFVWPSVQVLLAATAKQVDIPSGRLVVVGHSGAYWTIVRWLDEPLLDTIVLIDGAYGPLEPIADWLALQPDRRFIDVGGATRSSTDAFHRRLPHSLVFDEFPSAFERARDARVVYVRSDMGHMPLVTGGIAIPLLLRALAVPALAHSSG